MDSAAAALLSAADGSSVAALRGVTVLAEAALTSQPSLLPDELSDSLPGRCPATPAHLQKMHVDCGAGECVIGLHEPHSTLQMLQMVRPLGADVSDHIKHQLIPAYAFKCM